MDQMQKVPGTQTEPESGYRAQLQFLRGEGEQLSHRGAWEACKLSSRKLMCCSKVQAEQELGL